MKVTISNLRKLIREAADAYAMTERPGADIRTAKTVAVNRPDAFGGQLPNMRSSSPVEQKTKLVAKELQKMGKPIKSNDLLAFMKTFDSEELMVNNAEYFAEKFVQKQAN